MRNLYVLLGVMLLSSCASAPKMGADLGPCQTIPTIKYRSDVGRMGVCTPGESDTWRKLSVRYTMHSDYTHDGSVSSKGNFYAAPGQDCADMRDGLFPSSVEGCERHGASIVAK